VKEEGIRNDSGVVPGSAPSYMQNIFEIDRESLKFGNHL
jgi:hypothetical protein